MDTTKLPMQNEEGLQKALVSGQLPPTDKENYEFLLKEYHELNRQFIEWKTGCSEECKKTHETIKKLKAMKGWR